VFLIPALTVLVSLAFAAQVFNQYRTRGRPHQLVWSVALAFYAIGAFPEVTGALDHWSEVGYRVYYLFGGVLLVTWLSLGTVELLLGPGYRSGDARARAALLGYRTFVAVASMVGVVAVALAPLHFSHITEAQGGVPINCAMWCKSEPGYELANGISALSAALGNIVGTLVLAGGAAFSAYRAYRAGVNRNIPLGNLLIVAGALVPAATASLTRLGTYEFFYAGQAAGVALIFGGFLLIGSVTREARVPLSG
jgi:hypothetical protein